MDLVLISFEFAGVNGDASTPVGRDVPDCLLKRMALLMVSPHYLFFRITLTLRILPTGRDPTQH